jgi:hypothetical protein
VVIQLGLHLTLPQNISQPYSFVLTLGQIVTELASSNSWSVSTEEEIAVLVLSPEILRPQQALSSLAFHLYPSDPIVLQIHTLTDNAAVLRVIQKALFIAEPLGLCEEGRQFMRDCIQVVADRSNELINVRFVIPF